MNWKALLHSVIAAAISGAATAVAASIIDPSKFSVLNGAGWEHIGGVAAGGAFTAVLALLKSSPLLNTQAAPAKEQQL